MPDTTTTTTRPVEQSGTFALGDLTVHRLGYGAMQITGKGVWGEPADRTQCVRVLRRAVELGVDLIDTADSYGPEVSEDLIREALHPTAWSSPPRPDWCAPARASGIRSGVRSTSANSAR